MRHICTRSLAALVAMLSLWSGMASFANAATGPWNWSDMSDKLTERTNRPVWAVVRAEPYWYMTDGQELWSGGHVWKTDGSIVTDITLDVRNAGISRVDDMVSDGQTVMFLKNVTPRNNSIEAIAYNGSYANLTTKIRQNLSSDESLVQITGQNAVWGMITTYGRVILINQTKNETRTTQLANYKLTNASYIRSQVSPTGATLVFAIQPAQGKWLAMWEEVNGTERFVKIDEYGNTTALTSPSNPDDSIVTMASNGQNVLVGGYRSLGTNSTFAHVYDGTSFRSVTQYPMPNYWFGSVVGYNGKSWMIVQGKNLYRFDGTNFQTYGQTNDMFLTVSGNGSGTFLLGGALSTASNSNPSSPLTAKMVRVDEGTGYVAPTTGATNGTVINGETISTAKGISNRINYWAWFEPNWKYHDNITDPKYSVGAQSNDGIKRVELYIDGERQKVCDGKNSTKNVSCTMFIESTAYEYGTDVAINAKITSSKGRVAWIPVRNIQFYSGTVAHSNEQTVTAQMTVSPLTSTLTRGNSATINVTGYAAQGLNRMELYINGAKTDQCSIGGSTSNNCTFTINGSNYSVGSAVAFNVRVVDANGHDAWTWLGSYNIVDYGYVGTTISGDVTGSLNVDSWSGSGSNSSAYVKVLGSSSNGLSRIDTYANGSLYRSCTFSQTYGTQTCAFSMWASSFPNNNSIATYAIITDANGRQFTSNTVTLNFSNNTSYGGNTNTNGTNTNGLTVWFAADLANNTSLRRDLSKTVTVYGQSTNGLQKLDIYANNSLVQTCSFSDIVNSQQSCQTTIYGSNYSEGTNVYLNARATDRNGNTSWTSNLYLNITSNGTGNTGNTNVYFTVSPDDYNWNRTTNKTVTAYGSDSDGLRRLEIYMKGGLYKTCDFSDVYDTQSCNVTLYGADNSANSTIEINAKATDRYGNVSWATAKSYLMTNGQNLSGTASMTFSPSKTTYNTYDTVTAYASANDTDGIKRIDIYANGTIINSCVAPTWNSSYTCNANVYLGNYSSNNQVSIQAKVTDIYDTVFWTTTNYLQMSGSTNNNNTTSLSTWLTPNKTTYLNTDMPTFSTLATDSDGIKSIQLYKNGSEWKYCSGNNQTQVTCTETANFTSYTNNASVTFQGKTIDTNGNETWTAVSSVTIQNNTQPTNIDQPGSITITTDANNGYTNNQNVTFTATGSDPNGIGYIEILVDAKIVKTCTGTGTCSYTSSPLTANTASYGANLYDTLGSRTWTGYQVISKK